MSCHKNPGNERKEVRDALYYGKNTELQLSARSL